MQTFVINDSHISLLPPTIQWIYWKEATERLPKVQNGISCLTVGSTW